MIARALQPGAKVDTLWTFEGPQGTGKSLSLHALGGDFHAEISAAIGTTDFMRELRGIWLAEMSELDSLRGREASTVKRLLSAPSDRFVEKYAHATSYPRRAIAVASTNEATYWQDSTGARRLVPISARNPLDPIQENRLQWFAEARAACRGGGTWWRFPDDHGRRRPGNRSTRGRTSSRLHRARPPSDARRPRAHRWPRWSHPRRIMRDWLRLEPRQGQASGVRLGKVMRRLGFEPVRDRAGPRAGMGAGHSNLTRKRRWRYQADVDPFASADVRGYVRMLSPMRGTSGHLGHIRPHAHEKYVHKT